MHIHILGIGGTFMAGLARIAVACGHRVTGADTGLYPPMSTQLDALGIEVVEGYGEQGLSPAPDLVIIGNALSRGQPAVEYVLSRRIPYASGPAWLRSAVLEQRHVIALSGTHGKTTVSSLVTWMLEQAGRDPGFLVGGVLENFGLSARLGSGDVFVIEADEYDTAFFDKRSKFVHYCPRTLVINNLEFDHADIFPDLAAITRQFHHLIRTLPREALILRPQPDAHIDALLAQGCWSRVASFGTTPGSDWRFRYDAEAARPLTVPHARRARAHGGHASARSAQRLECGRRDRRGCRCRRRSGRGPGCAGELRQRQAPPRMPRAGRRRARVRRFRASSDGYRRHHRRAAPAGPAGAHHRGDRDAIQYHAPRRTPGYAGTVAGCG